MTNTNTEVIVPETPKPPERDFTINPVTEAEKQTLRLAHLYLNYTSLFNACAKLIKHARPTNKLKHQYLVMGPDLEEVLLNMDKKMVDVWGEKVEQKKE